MAIDVQGGWLEAVVSGDAFQQSRIYQLINHLTNPSAGPCSQSPALWQDRNSRLTPFHECSLEMGCGRIREGVACCAGDVLNTPHASEEPVNGHL